MLTIIQKAIRLLFITLDKMIAWAVGVLYELIVLIANVDVFGYYIFELMDRIYAFLAVFMVFKLSISVVNYVLNPDQLVDKSKGFGKLIQQVIIVIILIITVPSIFEWAYDLQGEILNTNVLYTIVTSQKNDSGYNITNAKTDEEKQVYIKMSAGSAGDLIKYNLMNTFIYSENSSSAIRGGSEQCRDIASDETGSKYADEYNKMMNNLGIQSNDSYLAGIVAEKAKYTKAYHCLVDMDTVINTSKKVDGSFTNYYQLGISTLCLGVTAYIFLTICFDVALRAVRLGVLQLMAPIPIISMLDPASGKSGMFSKWLKDCTKTYTSLFIRLLGVYFAIEIIKAITTEGSFVWRGTNIGVDNIFVRLFIILGCLMFAKQLPQFIESITGIKMDPGGLNLGKKLGSIPGAKSLGTLGKKTVAGLDARRHGRDFSEGFRKIEGTGVLSKFNKWKDGMTPYSAEQRKKSQQALNELNYQKRMYDKGQSIRGAQSKIAPGKTVGKNVGDTKEDIEKYFVDSSGKFKKDIDTGTLLNKINNYKQALAEQYGPARTKAEQQRRDEYINASVAKMIAGLESQRLTSLKNEAYDIASGTYNFSRITGAKTLSLDPSKSGKDINSEFEMNAAMDTNNKTLETVGKFIQYESEYQSDKSQVDSAIGISKGYESRSTNLK